MNNIFFIIGSGRSGTTAMVEVLNTATNGVVFTEQSPKLCVAARMNYEEALPYPKEFICKTKKDKIEDVLNHGKIYGDKNPNYLYFIQEISKVWDGKFLFLIRDGRDVVRSCMDFHAERGHGYARYEDDEKSLMLQPEDNFWDFVRLRPRKTTAIFKTWRKMEQFEKFAWGWAEFNRILLYKATSLDKHRYRIVNMTNLKAEDVESIFNFLGLKGFDLKKVSRKLYSKINTTNLEKAKQFPHWREWDKNLLAKFDKYAGNMMEKLDYY